MRRSRSYDNVDGGRGLPSSRKRRYICSSMTELFQKQNGDKCDWNTVSKGHGGTG